jgi:CRP-like cAMP-binding protein
VRGADPAVERLRAIAPFAACTELELRFIAGRSSLLRARAGTVLAREGAGGHEVGVILEGVAVVQRGGSEVARLARGDLWGEIAALDHGARTATVLAATDVLAVVCHEQEFRAIIEECPTVAHRVLVGLAMRMRSMEPGAEPGPEGVAGRQAGVVPG